MILARRWLPKAAAKFEATVGVMVLPTIPRAPETDNIRGAWVILGVILVEGIPGCKTRSLLKGGASLGGYTQRVFELEVGHRFSAAHAVSINGVMEELHGHDWHVRVGIRGRRLDSEDLLVDFHEVETALRDCVEPFSGRTMNGIPPFDEIMPTAERIAELVGLKILPVLASGVTLAWVSVEEAPGCIARWYPADPGLESEQ